MKVLVTCPPMLGMIDHFAPLFSAHGLEFTAANVVQTLSVQELIDLVPQHDGWIIGDDPATREVFAAGKAGNLKAAVKWGIGVDNVDFSACTDLGLPITNTPNMFGAEVADIALGYVTGLARQTFEIDREIRAGKWPKPAGISLAGKTVALIGLGDIGKHTAKRLLAADMRVIAYDPVATTPTDLAQIERAHWPAHIAEADFIVITCALTPSSRHLLNTKIFDIVKKGVRVINVGRGPIIDEAALCASLQAGQVFSAALDVFENEPLPSNSYLREHPRCIFGSHNSSNTSDAVIRTSELAINTLANFLHEQN